MKKHNIFHYFVNIVITLIKSIAFTVVWASVALGGYFIFESQKSPYNVILGIPLFLAGAGLGINALWTLILDITSGRFNRETCIFCKDL